MNQLITTVGQPATMSSREIADLLGSRHPDVVRSIGRLIASHVIKGYTPAPYTHEQNGQTYYEFLLEKRDTYIVVAQLSPEFTAKLVDRWQELEAAQAPAPTELSRMDILKLAMESEEARIKAEAERDEAIRTKALIGSKREATAMATAAAKSREVERLKHELGFSARHATILQVDEATGKDYDFVPLRRWCKANEVTPETVPDKRYPKGVKAWPAEAWLDCYGIDLKTLF